MPQDVVSRRDVKEELRSAERQQHDFPVNVRWVPFLKVKAKAFVDQWLHIATEDGSFRKIYAAWFD
jgi:hypothetical protein